jgi:DNA-binding XRE family transcriptional regulator
MRNKADISQAELALKLGLSVGFIGHIENPNQRAKYNLNHINDLAVIFKCQFSDFFPSEPFLSHKKLG